VLWPGSSWLALLMAKIAPVRRLHSRRHGGGGAAGGIEQGLGFAAESAFWSIPGMCATLTVLLGYLVGSELVPAPRLASIAAGVALGTVCFALAAALLSVTPLNRWSVIPVAAGACFGTSWMLRRLPDTAPFQRVAASPWLYAIRAGTSMVTVLTVTGLAHLLGPSGRASWWDTR